MTGGPLLWSVPEPSVEHPPPSLLLFFAAPRSAVVVVACDFRKDTPRKSFPNPPMLEMDIQWNDLASAKGFQTNKPFLWRLVSLP